MVELSIKGTGKFEVIESDTLVMSGTIRETKAPSQERLDDKNTKHLASEKYKISQRDFYNEMRTKQSFTNVQVINASRNIEDAIMTHYSSIIDLLVNILTPDKIWTTLRHMKIALSPKPCKSWNTNPIHSHDPTNVRWTEGVGIEDINNVVKVEYAALNPQDVLIANKSFYAEPSELIGKNRIVRSSLGLEFSGLDSNGDRVMGVTLGNSMSNFTWAVPKSWSFEDRATVPLSYLEAYSALIVKAEVKTEEKVMHVNPCTGFGLAVLNLAVQKKCDIFVSYETEAEKKLLKATVSSIPENRLIKIVGDNYRDDVLLKTNDQGVDVVICNNCKVKKLEVFFTISKRQDRVVLISDLNESTIHETIGMEIFLKEISLYSVVPKRIILADSATKISLSNMLKDGINSGIVKPLARNIYKRESLNEAFNNYLNNTQLGKIIVKVQPEGSNKNEAPVLPRILCSSQKSYLIIEGLTDFGLELIDWLVTRGAKRVVIGSSLNNDNGYKNLRLAHWQTYGVQIVLHKQLDLSQQQTIKGLFKGASSLGPVDGIFDLRRTDVNSSGSKDSLILTTRTDEESRSTCSELWLFVVCSAVANAGSLTSVKKFGQIKSNDSLQDEFVQEILKRRKKNGLHGLLIRWRLKNFRHYNNSVNTNITLPPVRKYLEKLDEILGTEEKLIEVSYIVSATNEVEEDPTEIEAINSEQKEAEDFVRGLYEQYGVYVEGFSYLQV
ncbi:hypothetical protein TSAR_016520 [Trichomalopsis sarcophagae]|uniref:Enoyl reductase (ER) domain-containing protein n=1 Tax=Trichomalopsis sarcophagae TaxID=543379 RepID=A0A232F8T2_9HYME|nr:hypothetical protein TSAR_016520 [Trichomalopsis sarcophagae]